MSESVLPACWQAVPLSDVATINPPLGLTLEGDALVNFVPMKAVEVEGGGLVRPEIRAFEEVRKGYTGFLSGDVIMAKITPCMENGKTTVAPDFGEGIFFGSTEFHVIRPEIGVRARWVERFLLQHHVRRAAQREMGGAVGQMRVPARFLESLRIPVAPVEEQARVIDLLDELLPDIDAAVDSLKRVKAKLKVYRASVLKAAVQGDLTAEWRANHPDVEPASELLKRILVDRRQCWGEDQLAKFKAKGQAPPKNWTTRYVKPVSPETDSLPVLPPTWQWASLDQIGRLDRGRSKHRPRDASFLYGGPYPFIQTGDVKKARQYLTDHRQTYSEAGLAQSRLWAAETLCITIAANIAETAILRYPSCFPDSIVGVECKVRFVSVRYVEFFLRHAREQISAYAPATAQKNINNEILRKLAVPLPPLEEQLQMVESCELHFSVIDHLEADIDAKLLSAKALRQSILRHAFEGKLVPQDPNDEPASELLKRIAVEREARIRRAPATRTPARKRKAKTA